MATTLSSLKSILSAAGVSATSLPSIIQALAANSPTSAVKAACTTILANSNNPSVVKDMAMKMAEIQGLPVAVVNLLPALTAAGTPLEVVNAVEAIETALGQGAGGLSLGSLL